MYIDDIQDIFDENCDPVELHNIKLSHLLYADDLILLSSSAKGLNCCLDKLHRYCNKWELELNKKKSKIMIFNFGGKQINGSFKYGELSLEITSQYCYLGVEIKPSGTFTVAKDVPADKARKAMMPLISTIFQFRIPISRALLIYFTLLYRPLLHMALKSGIYKQQNKLPI